MKRVVAAMRDPNPKAARGGEALAASGIVFEHGLLEVEARELNIGFVSRMTRGRPWVRMKIAATLDGRTALPDGKSQWITGAEARRDAHRWRARACAILTGIGTVRADDPRLTVREVDTPRQPLRVIVDSRLETPRDARIPQFERKPPQFAQLRRRLLTVVPGRNERADAVAFAALECDGRLDAVPAES